MTEELEEKPEEAAEKLETYYFDVTIGSMTARLEFTDQTPDVKKVLGMAMAISPRNIFLDEVWFKKTDYWASTSVGVGFHVGANAKASIMAEIQVRRY